MDTNAIINSHVDNHFDFDLSVNGLKGENVVVRFVIEAEPFCMVFPCERKIDTKWSLHIPKLPGVEPATYRCYIEAMIDGYYFRPHEGSITVAKTPEVYVNKEQHQTKVRARPEPITPTQLGAEQPETAAPEPPRLAVGDTKLKELIDRLKSGKGIEIEQEEEEQNETTTEVPSVEDEKEDEVKKEEKVEKEEKDDSVEDSGKEKDTKDKDDKKEKQESEDDESDAGESEDEDEKKKLKEEQAKKIFAEARAQAEEKKKRDQQLAEARRQRALERQAKEKTKPTPKPVIEEKQLTPSEKDEIARRILAEAREEKSEQSKKSAVKFKKGNQVIK